MRAHGCGDDKDINVENLRITTLTVDWKKPGLTDWTRRAGVLFEADFMNEYRLGSFPLLLEPPVSGEAACAFINYVLHRKSGSATDSKRASRRRTRRQKACIFSPLFCVHAQLYNQRLKTLQRLEFPDAALNAIRLLGTAGMSSEESEGEVGKMDRTYHISTLAWRASSLNDWLRGVDKLPSTVATSSRRTYTRHLRTTGYLTVVSSRSPPTGLPVSFYNNAWLESRSNLTRMALQVSDKALELPSVSMMCL
jgi:hypothetical protein